MKIVNLKHFLLHKSIFSKILFSHLLLIFLLVSLIGFFSFKTSEQIVSKQISLSNYNMINQVEKNIDFVLAQVIAVVNIYNQNPDLEEDLKKKPADPYLKFSNARRIQAKMQNYSYILSSTQYQMILIGKNDDVYSIPDGISQISSENITQYGWYRQMLADPDKIFWLTTRRSFLKSDRDYYFTGVKALQNGYSKDFYGILLISVAESNLYDIYEDSLNNGNQIMIIDSRGKVISHGDRSQVGKVIHQRKLLQLIRNESQNHRIITLNKTQFICDYKNIANTDWYIVNMIPLTVFSKDISAMGLKILMISIFCILPALAIALFLSRKITLPLVNLSKRIKGSYHPDETAEDKPKFQNEIDLLAREYDHIIGELEKTIHNLVKEQEEKRKAELQALQAQINPHFLYNTLNSIKCLVWTGQVNMIEPTVNALINLLEQTINTKKSEWITLTEELDNIRSYMSIQKIRLSREVQLSFNVPDHLCQCKIPKLLLQPIVENAIFHGIEPTDKPGRIYIECTDNGQSLKIDILDDGAGIDRETIAKIFTGEHNISNRFSGIGLKNVDERLKLYFGAEFGLTIESAVGVGTSVVVKIPKIT